MFDKLYLEVPRNQYHNHNINVTEKRASTDDSIRLAREYEDRAWKIVEKRILQTVPAINAQFIKSETSMETMEIFIMFTVNGERFTVKVGETYSAKEIYQKISEAISEKLMEKIMLAVKL